MSGRTARVRRPAPGADPGELYRQIADAIPQMVWTGGADGALDYFNRRVLEYTGMDPGTLAGWGWQPVIHPEDLPACLARWRHALETGEPYEIEYRLRRHDGVYRWHLGAALPLRDSAGRILRWFGTCTDIDDRKSAAQALERAVVERTRALRESEERFRMLTELSSDWYWEQDENLRFVMFSTEVESTAGSTVASHLGKARWELPTVGVSEEEWARHRATLEAHRPFRDFEYRRINERGQEIWISASGQPVFEADGRFRGYRGVGRNITGRKRAERALQESLERYQSLVSSIDGIVWEVDARTMRFLFVSERAERLLGYPLRRWLEEPDFWRAHLHPEDRDGAVEFCAQATAQKRDHELEYRMLAADGRIVWLRDLVTVVMEGGAVKRLRGIMIDVTDRRALEVELRESESRNRAIVETSQDAILVRQGEYYVYANPAAARLYGVAHTGELLARPILDFAHPQDRELFRERMRRMDRGEARLAPVEARIRRPDGSTAHLEIAAAQMTFNGRPAVLSIQRDVSERTALREIEKHHARQMRRLLDRLHRVQEDERRRIAVDLHDVLGQKLTALGIGLNLLRHELPVQPGDPIDARLDDLTRLLEDTVEEIRTIVRDLRPPMLDECGLVPALYGYAERHAGQGGPRVVVAGREIDPRLAYRTELALFRIVQEALTNALKHSGATEVRIEVEPRVRAVRISVEDNGRGFTDGGPDSPAASDGLGLTAMRERAEAIGGTLRVESSSAGTCVTVEVPAGDADPRHPG
jgi:PAS domain S-box-containing protein